jgi:hypothetical protein
MRPDAIFLDIRRAQEAGFDFHLFKPPILVSWPHCWPVPGETGADLDV